MQVLNISAKFVCAFLLYLFSFSASTATAQTLATQDTTSLASLLVKAREFAFNKERVQARNLCREILARDSTYWDAAVLMGRTLSLIHISEPTRRTPISYAVFCSK